MDNLINDFKQKLKIALEKIPGTYKEVKNREVQHSTVESGCYVLWGNEKVRKQLLIEKKIYIHSSKNASDVGLDNEVMLDFKLALQRSYKANDLQGSELFCLYIGKTANLKKRQTHQFLSFFRRFADTGVEKLDTENCYLTFIEEGDWQKRFYLENYLIAELFPVVNLQPER